MCLNKGKKHTIHDTSNGGSKECFHYYLLNHDFGYTFVFKNSSRDKILDEYIYLNMLKNLRMTPNDQKISNGKPFWKFEVHPGNIVVKHLRRIRIKDGYNMSYTFHHEFLNKDERISTIKERSAPNELNDEEIVEIVQAKGKREVIKCTKTKKNLQIGYKVHYFGSYYGLYFENLEREKILDSTFTFKVKNLKMINPTEDQGNFWKIYLKPGQSCLRKLERINPSESVQYSLSYSYYIRDS